jgi:hypothetical protein
MTYQQSSIKALNFKSFRFKIFGYYSTMKILNKKGVLNGKFFHKWVFLL